MPSRFLSENDRKTLDTFNHELIGKLAEGKDCVINQSIVLYKISRYDTETNLYGEAAKGKIYQPGIQIACTVEATDFDFTTDEFGPDLRQDGIFSFIRQTLVDLGVVVELGDIFDWNYAHWEVSNINENQLVGCQVDANWAVICAAFLVRKSNLQIERIRSI